MKILLLLMFTVGILSCQSREKVRNNSEFIVVGTLHSAHLTSEKFHPDVFRTLIDTLNPDLIAVEIRPEDIVSGDLKNSAFDMKEIIYPYGIKLSIPVTFFDWWPQSMRNDRKKLIGNLSKTAKGIEKIAMASFLDELKVHGSRYRDFDEMSFQYVQSPVFSKFDKGIRDKMTKIFLEGPGNLFWNTRHRKMLGYLKNLARLYPNKKILVFTGASHRVPLTQGLLESGLKVSRLDKWIDADTIKKYQGHWDSAEFVKNMILTSVRGKKAKTHPSTVNMSYISKLMDIYKNKPGSHPGIFKYMEAEYNYLSGNFKLALKKFIHVSRMQGVQGKKIFWMPLDKISSLRAANMMDLLEQHKLAKKTYVKLVKNKKFMFVRKYIRQPYTSRLTK